MFNVKCIDEYKYLPYKHDKVIYLTFDDGPSPNTNKVLDILNRNNVKATFFVIGNQVEMHKDVVKRLERDGMCILPHTNCHNYRKIYDTADDYFIDLNSCVVKIKDVILKEPVNFIRFPGGVNNELLRESVLDEIKSKFLDNKYYFIRSAPGSAVLAEEGTAVETFAAEDKKTSDIIILFAGTNLAPDRDTVGELIRAQKQMLEFLGCERYLIVGLTSLAMAPDIVPVNQALAEEFGEHFLDVRAYLLEHGLEDAKIKPSAQDEKDLKAGEIPSSLRVDIVHGNEAFYRIIGEQVYQKLDDMNYISEDDKK